MMDLSNKLSGWSIMAAMVIMVVGCAKPAPPPSPPAPADRIVLLPNADGSPSAVVLKTAAGERVIDRPYDAVSINQGGVITPTRESPESVRARYGSALNAQPKRPVSYTVYFVSGKNEITPESQAVIDKMKTELKTRSAPEISVIGHTDRVGKLESNDALSLKRAEVLVKILIAGGIAAESIEAAGRGEREPLVPTADEVAEPRNRRVEINVR